MQHRFHTKIVVDEAAKNRAETFKIVNGTAQTIDEAATSNRAETFKNFDNQLRP